MNKKINKVLPKEQRLGQIGKNLRDEIMKIVVYRNSNDVDIMFIDDGSITKHKAYKHFTSGKIAHPFRYEQSFAYHIEVELGLDINKIWNFEKNTVSPYEIYKSGTEKVWLYCLEKDYHNDEGGYEMVCHDFSRGQRCGYCGGNRSKVHRLDSLAHLYPLITEMIISDERNNVTIEDLYKVSPRSDNRYYFKCSECGESGNNKKRLSSVITQGFSCEYCSDGLSIPEKFMINILKQLDLDVITQLTRVTFEWCKDYRYDFYIPSLSMIIETHGRQHYKRSFEGCGGRTLEEEQENDRLKKELALNNNIKSYIVVNCSYSSLNWLKENVIKELDNYFDLSNIDWNLAWENSLKSLVWESKRLHEEGYNNKQIAEILGINRKTVEDYKKQLGIKNQYERKQENLLKTKELVQQGKPIKEIAEILNVTTKTIREYKKELNL